MKDTTNIVLSRAEAVVLFEQLSRYFEHKHSGPSSPIQFDDVAEYWAMLGLHGALERQLTEPFEQEYKAILSRCRTQLRTERGDTVAQD